MFISEPTINRGLATFGHHNERSKSANIGAVSHWRQLAGAKEENHKRERLPPLKVLPF